MRILAVIAGLACTIAVQHAHAQRSTTPPTTTSETDAQARIHFDAGRAYYAGARYADAAREFREAYQLSGRLPLLLNIARALEGADDNAGAIAALDEYLARTPEDDPNRGEATERRRRLGVELDEERRAQANAVVNDTAEAPEPEEGDEASGGGSPLRTVGWISLGAGVGAGVVAVATGLVAHGIHQDLAEDCPFGSCDRSLADDIDRGRRLARTSTAMTFVGVAAAGAGLALILVGGDDDPPENALRIVPLVDRRTAGALVSLSF